MRDREEAAMPGGVDICDHQQVFSALFEKVRHGIDIFCLATPQQSFSIHIIRYYIIIMLGMLLDAPMK